MLCDMCTKSFGLYSLPLLLHERFSQTTLMQPFIRTLAAPRNVDFAWLLLGFALCL